VETFIMAEHKLIVLDDEPMIRQLVCNVARSGGWETFETGDPHVFETEIRKDPPQAILLDLVMPGIDGIEILRELAEPLGKIPILLMSGMDDRLLESATQLG
jgi:DNA-binding response OmpR family regulator